MFFKKYIKIMIKILKIFTFFFTRVTHARSKKKQLN